MTVGGIMFLLGGLMLVEYNTLIISPDDFHILGSLPVSSRTYFFARIAYIIFYIVVFVTMLGLPSVIVFSFDGSFSLVRFFFAGGGIYGAGLFVGLGTAVAYGLLLKVISPVRMKKVLSWFQFILSFVFYGAYIIFPSFSGDFTQGVQIEKAMWLHLFPPSWFASIVEFGGGFHDLFNSIGALLGLAGTLALFGGAFSRISLDYAGRISAMLELAPSSSNTRKKATKTRRRLRVFKSRERLIVSRLAWAQFRFDNKFRLSILGVIPLLIMYFFIGLRKGALLDPFVYGSEGVFNFFVFFFALLMIPMLIKQNMETSDAYEASWLFFACPVDLPRLIVATRDVLFLCFSAPCLVFISGVFFYYFENALHAILHTLTIAFLSFIFLQIIYIFRPQLPFAEPRVRGSRARWFGVLFLMLPLGGVIFLGLIIKLFYQSPLNLVATFPGFLLIIYSLEHAIRKRVLKATENLQFEG